MLSHYKARLQGATDPVARLLFRARVRPNHLTVVGFGVSALAASALAQGRLRLGALLLALAGLFDFFDGSLARIARQESSFGAFLDSVVDRVSDTLLFLGVALYYFYLPVETGRTVSAVLTAKAVGADPVNDWLVGASALVALVGSYMVSYTRARAEGLGTDCKVGWFERPERLIVLLGAALFGPAVMEYALLLLAVMTWLTVVQRVLHVRRRLGSTPL